MSPAALRTALLPAGIARPKLAACRCTQGVDAKPTLQSKPATSTQRRAAAVEPAPLGTVGTDVMVRHGDGKFYRARVLKRKTNVGFPLGGLLYLCHYNGECCR